jgi:hypothetical protein
MWLMCLLRVQWCVHNPAGVVWGLQPLAPLLQLEARPGVDFG